MVKLGFYPARPNSIQAYPVLNVPFRVLVNSSLLLHGTGCGQDFFQTGPIKTWGTGRFLPKPRRVFLKTCYFFGQRGFRTFGERARNTPITHATDVVFPYVQLVCGSNARLKTPVTPLLSVLWAFHWKCQKNVFLARLPPRKLQTPLPKCEKALSCSGFSWNRPRWGRGGGLGRPPCLRPPSAPTAPPPRPIPGKPRTRMCFSDFGRGKPLRCLAVGDTQIFPKTTFFPANPTEFVCRLLKNTIGWARARCTVASAGAGMGGWAARARACNTRLMAAPDGKRTSTDAQEPHPAPNWESVDTAG